MKLWTETTSVDGKKIEKAVMATVEEMIENIDRKVLSRGVRAMNALRNAEINVLKGQRSGRVYRVPYSKKTYTASAPGESPARRTGALRLHWNGDVKARNTSRGIKVTSVLESCEEYASALENGTSKMAPRPFVEKIKEKAMPEIQRIYNEPYT